MFDSSPFDRMERCHDLFSPAKEIDDFEKRFFGRPLQLLRTDVRETEKEYILEAELPGFTAKEIRLTVKNHLLTISAERCDSSEAQDRADGYLRRERSRGCVRRSFDISGTDCADIRASFRDGILTVTLPKPPHPRDEEREIPIC